MHIFSSIIDWLLIIHISVWSISINRTNRIKENWREREKWLDCVPLRSSVARFHECSLSIFAKISLYVWMNYAFVSEFGSFDKGVVYARSQFCCVRKCVWVSVRRKYFVYSSVWKRFKTHMKHEFVFAFSSCCWVVVGIGWLLLKKFSAYVWF